MQINGFALTDADGAEISRWQNLPDRIDLPTGDVVFGVTSGWANNGFSLNPVSWDEPDPVPPRVLVLKSVIIDRLHTLNKLDAARAALDAADLYTRERWNSRDSIYADDPTAIALLQSIDADAAVVLAP